MLELDDRKRAAAELIASLPCEVELPPEWQANFDKHGRGSTADTNRRFPRVHVPVAGIAARGPRGYLVHYVRPNPLLFPLHVVSELSRTVALALRLFGNMMSGHLVVGLIVALVGPFVPVPLMALDLLIGLLQAYIFTVLACVYIGAAIRVGEGT